MGNESAGNDERSERFVRILPVLRRQAVLRSRQVSWLRRKLLAVFPFPGEGTEWFFKRQPSIHSGGTAPAFHRTSLLSPEGRLRTLHS
jgi:hypothetical protein